MLRRRELLGLLLGATAVRPLRVFAQQVASARLGFIHSSAPNYFEPFRAAFLAGLKETGYTEHNNLAIELRWAEGRYERLPALVTDLLDQKVDVLFAAGGTDPARAAKAATQTTPIVFVSAADPVATALVASLSRPGGCHRRQPARFGAERQEVRPAARPGTGRGCDRRARQSGLCRRESAGG